jgi:hypothetical protein
MVAESERFVILGWIKQSVLLRQARGLTESWQSQCFGTC